MSIKASEVLFFDTKPKAREYAEKHFDVPAGNWTHFYREGRGYSIELRKGIESYLMSQKGLIKGSLLNIT